MERRFIVFSVTINVTILRIHFFAITHSIQVLIRLKHLRIRLYMTITKLITRHHLHLIFPMVKLFRAKNRGPVLMVMGPSQFQDESRLNITTKVVMALLTMTLMTTTKGGEFRTDGVDIETATDIEQGYNIGWLYNGEWLNYTIDVAATGSYTFDFRVASNDSGSEMYWALDGVALTELIAIPSTGSWQTWITITKPDIQLEAGEHTLTLHITDGEFNLNYVDISQASP